MRTLRRGWREYAAWSLAAILLILLGIAISRPASSSTTPPADAVVFSVYPPVGGAFRSTGASVQTPKLAVAPDGRHLVFVAAGPDGVPRLWLRPLDAIEARPLAGTENGAEPFWSPDSRRVAFVAGAKLQWVDINGGAPHELSAATLNANQGGSWSSSGVILVTPELLSGLMRVPTNGGAVVQRDLSAAGVKLLGGRWPHFIDGERFLFWHREGDGGRIYLGSLDSPTATALVASSWGAHVSQGFLLFLTGTTLMAQPFGPDGSLKGDAVPLRTNVAGASSGYPAFSTSATGVLAYASPRLAVRELRWFSRSGTATNAVTPAGDYIDFRLSPDESHVAYSRADPVTQAPVLWVKDLRSEADRKVTSDPPSSHTEASVLWSPSGSEFIYRSNRDSTLSQLYRMSATGVGEPRIVLGEAQLRELAQSTPIPTDWSPNGNYLVYHAPVPKFGYDLFALSVTDGKVTVLSHSVGNDLHGSISQDSRWVAYASSDESGRYEVYVQAFPDPKERWTISTEGGSEPRWSANGRELLYLRRDGMLMSVPIETAPSFAVKGHAVPLFKTQVTTVDPYRVNFVPSKDGNRILMSAAINTGDPPAITVVLNWPALLKK